ncbi:MAG: diacylglycerol kinase family protein [Actinomycetota bacterium]|jgi:diacylglycerol kinase|nr:diacylglycerol kinase family protein [Actinomycetota bacterium]MDD5600436.1 diacylglycerol kinase family protein [Actinomycetota bacterium]
MDTRNTKEESKNFSKGENNYNRKNNKKPLYYKRSMCLSFRYAATGILKVIRTERSFRIQLVLGILAIVAGFLLKISVIEWIFIILIICIVLSLEMLNTSFELIIDMVTEEYKIIAEHIKDIAAGAVLVASITALIVGLIIFIPHIIMLFN